ncbi:hypothetical protein LCER1_G002307 [Lachnellula cervina]|uniref:RSE1/DDB1/CPSF1 first beta-propeller domain-containing protein n=1 Tax=Lachnellula cervina TaxID=1316786 RepID=A0A7D8UPF1_9HELO|nr:hypothetical protein LCER1_G002307 [Lachnellula cervina]
MAFETNTLVNGEWTTRTLDINTVLKHFDQETKETNIRDLDIERAPTLGLLTQTVIRSPLVHWILPARLRNAETNDVAFIGDDFVQIKELRPDRQLWDVIRKENFGARIRNARVFGSMDAFDKERNKEFPGTQIEDEGEDVGMHVEGDFQNGRQTKIPLSPQSIILQLDTGDTIFLSLRHSEAGELEFVSSRHRLTKAMSGLQPGMHLAIDPSSRYMAMGCSEHMFAIYALRSREELSRQHIQGSSLQQVESESCFVVQGIILKMEFLYPSPGDDTHIILILLVVAKGRTRILRYEWETESELANVRPGNQRGHLLQKEHQMPLFLIPLTIKSSFILIYDTFMTVAKGILEGYPKFFDFYHSNHPPTSLYHGRGIPLWTSWARPARTKVHTISRDDMYIVREDGIVRALEIDADVEELVGADMIIGELEGNCGTALASLDFMIYGPGSGDMLVTGGDSCSGGTYLVRARQSPTFIEPIQNWSPSPDFITTYAADDQAFLDGRSRRKKNTDPRPNKIYACAGKGSKGVITEFRYGLEAKLGLEMDYQIPIMEAWVLCPTFDSLDDDDDVSIFLLSLGDHSAVLQLSGDARDIDNLEQEETKFDLRYRTLAASMHGSFTIQVTEQTIVLIIGSQVQVHEKDEILTIREDSIDVGHGVAIDKALIHEDLVLYTSRLNNSVYLQILEQKEVYMETDGVSRTEPETNVRTLGKYSSQVTGLAICQVAQDLYAIITEMHEDSIILIFEAIRTTNREELKFPTTYGDDIRLEAFVSISVASRIPGIVTLLCGTRNGYLLTLDVSESTFQIISSRCDRFGVSQTLVKRDVQPHSGELFFVSCDSNIFVLATDSPVLPPSSRRRSPGWAINQVWLTDATRPGLQQPDISSIARLKPSSSGGADGGLILVVGNQLLMAAFSSQPKSVPRHIPVGGTPTRVLYSQNLGLLIVGAIVNNKTTLLFIDPHTGEDLSAPCLKSDSGPADFISGLGRTGDRIYHLLEWSFTKEKKTWNHVIVATSSGRLLVVTTRTDIETRRNICFWTKYQFRLPGSEPIYSVTGFPEGLLWCSGSKLLCDTLDLKEKKFQRIAEYDLPSPATAISYDNGIIYALTNSHSLEVLTLVLDDVRGAKITRTHGDQITRNTLHHPSGRPIHLVSDKHCSVVGLWATHDTKADTLETVFEADLSHSVLKFRSGRCRPLWDPCWTSSGMGTSSIAGDSAGHENVPRSANRSELLGLSIDGSLSQHTILEYTEWRFLRFLINLAIRSPKVCEFAYKDDPVPLEPLSAPKLMMHVDGDILKRCLAERNLEILLHFGKETKEAIEIFSKFCELLQELHEGKLDEHADAAVYVEQAYTDLAFYLRPVL